jgi:hypothetical protein
MDPTESVLKKLTGEAGSRTIEIVIVLGAQRLLARANSNVSGGFAP